MLIIGKIPTHLFIMLIIGKIPTHLFIMLIIGKIPTHLFIMLIIGKIPTHIGMLTFMHRLNSLCSVELSIYLYKPCVLLVGQWQTVQNVSSDQGR